MSKEEAEKKIKEIEAAMQAPDFWQNPAKAQLMIGNPWPRGRCRRRRC
jgi:hypothetical protein